MSKTIRYLLLGSILLIWQHQAHADASCDPDNFSTLYGGVLFVNVSDKNYKAMCSGHGVNNGVITRYWLNKVKGCELVLNNVPVPNSTVKGSPIKSFGSFYQNSYVTCAAHGSVVRITISAQ